MKLNTEWLKWEDQIKNKINMLFTTDTCNTKKTKNQETHQDQNNYFVKYANIFGFYFATFLIYILCDMQYINVNDIVWYTNITKSNSWTFLNIDSMNVSNLFLTLGCVYTLFLGRIKKDLQVKNFLFGLFFYVITLASLYTFNYLVDVNVNTNLYWTGSNLIDSTTNILQLLILLTAYAIIYVALTYTSFGKREENLIAVTFLIYFLLNLLKAENLIFIFISTLGTTLSMSFMMLGSKTTATEAAYKYVVQSAVVGTFFMFGLTLLLLSSYGSVSLLEISILSDAEKLQGGFSLVLLAVLFKLSQFPNHQWAPEIYAGITNPVLGLFLIPMKIGFIGLLYRIVLLMNSETFPSWLLFISSTVSIVLGAWGALRQNTLPRFLGWTSISNVGLILLPLVWFTENSKQAIDLSLVYLVVYSTLLTVLWFVLSTTLNTQNESIVRVSDLYKIKTTDLSRVNIAALLLVLGGVPPFLGFVLKVSILNTYLSHMLNIVFDLYIVYEHLSPLIFSLIKLICNVYVYGVILFGLSITLWNYLGLVGIIYRRENTDSSIEFKSVLSCKVQYLILFGLMGLTLYSTDILSLITKMSDTIMFVL